MKIEHVESLAIPELKVIRFGRFRDQRGFFTESYRQGDLSGHPSTDLLRDVRFVQINESFSRSGVVRGLHFQWNPYMGKLVRAVRGHVIDLALDIRIGSPTLGKVLARDISDDPESNHGEWIWVPPGFAHGIFCKTDCVLEYLCSGEYNAECESGISPLSPELDWSLCDADLKEAFDALITGNAILSEKDREAVTLTTWLRDSRSAHFIF